MDNWNYENRVSLYLLKGMTIQELVAKPYQIILPTNINRCKI